MQNIFIGKRMTLLWVVRTVSPLLLFKVGVEVEAKPGAVVEANLDTSKR